MCQDARYSGVLGNGGSIDEHVERTQRRAANRMSVAAMDAYRRTVMQPAAQFDLDPAMAPASLDAAYAAIRGEMGKRPASEWAGWKLGGTNHATKANFGVDEAYFGALHRSEMFVEAAAAPRFALCQVQGEVEIALRIARDGAGHDGWAVALEMPSSAIANLPGAGVAALVADRCGAGALLLGPVRDGALPDLSSARFVVECGGVERGAGDYASLLADPVELLAEFIALARRHGFHPRPGDWVSTGGITACYGFASGERVVVKLDGDVEIDCVMDLLPPDSAPQ